MRQNGEVISKFYVNNSLDGRNFYGTLEIRDEEDKFRHITRGLG